MSVGDVGAAEVDGMFEGDSEVLKDGLSVGNAVGLDVGTFVGRCDGEPVGETVVGRRVGVVVLLISMTPHSSVF